ncbi:MAG: SRPBCC domain-containing protein [Planctomycetes bacterium]|nr:SRPBCC domain-containing protein [Planctomycetota bacterium]
MKMLVKETLLPHPQELVWASLTRGPALAQWLMPNNFPEHPLVGDKFEFRMDPVPLIGSTVKCEILELDPPYKMVWSWTGMNNRGAPQGTQRIEWTLVAKEAGTQLIMHQRDMNTLPWIMRTMMTMGWGTMLGRWLPIVLHAFIQHDGAWEYQGVQPAPNRSHHSAKTVPASYFN